VLGEMVICTSRGPVSLNDGQIPVPSEHHPQCPCCALGCLSSCAGGPVAIPLATPPVAAVDRAIGDASLPAAVDSTTSYLRLTTSHPRAPPALIS
jgi:hypothetical protein